MLFRSQQDVVDDALFVHVHVPRTGGTSLRLLLNRRLGRERCLMNYFGEVFGRSAQELQEMRCISGHVPYGVHQRMPRRPALYLTTLRHPVDRYRSTYAAFLADPDNPHHELAQRLDINAFLRHLLDCDEPSSLQEQGNNLQCRMVCGEANADRAREFIDQRYFLAAPYPRLEEMLQLLSGVLHRPQGALPWAHRSESMDYLWPDRMRLSAESIELLMQHEREDALLFSHVQRSFAALMDAGNTEGHIISMARPDAPVPPVLPPVALRFMGDSDSTLVSYSDVLAFKVLDLAKAASGTLPRRLLDVGCGYGRLAYGLRRAAYDGSYVGFDILRRHIEWLNHNFAANADDTERYHFNHLDRYSERYNPGGARGDELSLGYPEASFDCIASLSVFTHMYEDEVVRYVSALARVLETGGIWVTTVFCLPGGFKLQDAAGDGTYAPVKQVSEHAFVHNPAEPLHVIAYTEEFLLRLFARHGLEVVDQRKGRWLTKKDAVDLQDWFVLRKREHWSALETRSDRPAIPRCNICGGTAFGPGPNNRTAANGRPPCCLQCKSLERHRIARRIFQALPHEFLGWRKGLQFSPDGGLDGCWFRSWEVSIFDGDNSLDLQDIHRADGSYDFLSLSHVLESVPDDLAGFEELCRILSPAGIMHITFGAPLSREKTIDLETPQHAWKAYHMYGRDLAERFGCRQKGLELVVVEATDPATGVNDAVHLFIKNPADAVQVRALLEGSGEALRLS